MFLRFGTRSPTPMRHVLYALLATARSSLSPSMKGRSSPSRWRADCIIATRDAQPERELRSHTASGVSLSCARCATLRCKARMAAGLRAFDNAGQSLNSLGLRAFADITYDRATDDVVRNDSPD